jgi:hypothetical protein
MDQDREELRGRIRTEPAPPDAALVLRGGPDTVSKLRMHARRTARAWCLDGVPVVGISVFGVHLLPTGHRPHVTVVIASDDEDELHRLLACLGPPRENYDGTLAPQGRRGGDRDRC